MSDEDVRAWARRALREKPIADVLLSVAKELGIEGTVNGEVGVATFRWLPPLPDVVTLKGKQTSESFKAIAAHVLAARKAFEEQEKMKLEAEQRANRAKLLPESVQACLNLAERVATAGNFRAEVCVLKDPTCYDGGWVENEFLPAVMAELRKLGFQVAKFNWCQVEMTW